MKRLVWTAIGLARTVRVEVVGHSMEPSLLPGDRLLVRRPPHGANAARRGDMVFLRDRGAGGPARLKRVVGLPFEQICVAGDAVRVDGRLLPEPYRHRRDGPTPGSWPQTFSPRQEWRLAEDQYVVLGDNRGHSSDSRSHGPISGREILGVAWYRYAPAERRGRIADPAPGSRS